MENTSTEKTQKDQPKILRFLAIIVSYIFHPVFMPTLMAIILYKLAPTSFSGVTDSNIGMIFFRIAYLTAFYSILTVLLLKGLGFIENIQLKTARERTVPLMATMIFYFWAYWVFKNINAPFILRVLLLGSFWGIILVFLINIFVKISLHTAAAGGMLGILIVLMLISPVNMVLPFFVILLIAGIIGTARMILGSHNNFEIWIGYLVGIIVQLAAYLYLS